MDKGRLNRRDILTAGAVFGTAVAAESLDPAASRTIQGEMPWSPGAADKPRPAEPGSYRFFSTDEAAFTEAAVARLIPADDLGPGAKELGVPTFIDRQLAGSYGRAERWYMLGPWRNGSPTQGYQSRLTPAQMFRYAIKAIDQHLRDAKSGKTFSQLSPSEQDNFLNDLENDKVDLPAVSGKAFFEELLQVTIEGFFADPIYGGNRDMAAWKMIGFPGARYDYRDYVSKHGQRFPLPPVSLQGRPDWNIKG